MKSILIFILYITISISTYAQETVKCESDEHQNVTLCKTESVNLSTSNSDVSRATLHLVYIFEIKSYLLVPSFTSNDWQYSDTEQAHFLIDGESRNYQLQKVDSKETPNTVIEQYYIQLSPEDVDHFNKAEEVRFELDNDIYNLSDEAKNKLKALVKKATELQKT